MKLYNTRIPAIANAVVTTLVQEGAIEVDPENRPEAEKDLIAIMEEYRRRDNQLRDAVKEHMAALSLPYERYGKVRQELADQWDHPLNNKVEGFLARQFMENFMISRFVDEVFAEDGELYKRIQSIVKKFDVDEAALRTEAEERIKNVRKDSVEYEAALERALKEVRKRHGLVD